MPNITRFNTLILSFFLFSFAAVFGESFQYENKIIEKIEFVLSDSPSNGHEIPTIKAKIKSKEGEQFSQLDFDNDLKILAQNFDRVIPEVTAIDQKIYITLKVFTKPTIRSICWIGNHKVKTKCLEKELGIPANTIFDRQAFNKAFHKLKTYYVKEGFFEAALEYRTIESEGCNEVDVEISICEGRAGRIKKIIFNGVDKCERNEILDLVVSKTYNLFTSWMTSEGTYNEDAILQDQFSILNYLQNKGYADATVNIEVCETDEKNRIILVVHIEKGSLYTIGEITFEGNEIFRDDEIWNRIIIKSGYPYSPDEIRKTVTSITTLCGKRGYIDAVVDYEPKIVCDECVYSIHFTITEGEAFRVGLIKVMGNCTTQTKVILHETLLIPGEVFNSEKLQATETRLKNVGFFEDVNVYAVKSDANSILGGNYRDVHIEVSEGSTGQVGASGGYSTTEGLFGSINLTENNFNSKGLSRIWSDGLQAIRGGGEYANLAVTYGTKSRSYIFSWTKPYYRDTQWSVGFDLENSSTRYIDESYNILANGLTLHATKQVNAFVRAGYHYRLRYSKVEVKEFDETKITPNPKLTDKENAEELALIVKSRQDKIEQIEKDAGLVSAVGFNIVYDTTDHPTRPYNGLKSKLESEIAGLGGKFHFLAFAYLNSYFIPAGKDAVIKFQADFKLILPTFKTNSCAPKFITVIDKKTKESKLVKDDCPSIVPLDERLFLGGDNTVRGYRAYKLGPVYAGTKDPKGGVSLQFLSVEYSKRIFSRLDAFIYCDSGSVTDRYFSMGRMYTAAGFGIRFQIFPGSPPLSMGIGFPFNAKSKGQEKMFFLNVGGKF